MQVTLTPYTFILQDTNFFYETYRGPGFSDVSGIVDFRPEKGYISLQTNLGELPFTWHVGYYPAATFNRELIVKQVSESKGLSNITIDDLCFSCLEMDEVDYVAVSDNRNTAYHALLAVNSDNTLAVIESSFTDAARRYQMLYYAEHNKSTLKELAKLADEYLDKTLEELVPSIPYNPVISSDDEWVSKLLVD